MSLGARRRRPPTPRFVANDLWRRAGEVPSFHIAPARTQNARDLITGSVLGTYNSASPAWAVGPDGVLFQPAANAPVIEYDPVTLQCLGARIWGVVTNSLLQSENLASTWSVVGATVNANIATSPNGTLTADKIEETATTGEHRASQASAGGATTSAVTFSVFAKAAERTKIRLAFSSLALWSGGGGAAVIFDLTAGSGSVDNSTPTAFGIQAYPNGWYRCWITGTPTVSLTPTANAFLFTTFGIYAGTAGSGAFLWGAQLNTGPLAPYVPTTTTAASSTADVWSITGADFSRVWNQAAVTMYAEAVRDVVPATDGPVLIDARNVNGFETVQCSYLAEAVAGSLARSNNVIQAELYPTGLSGIRTRRVAAAFAQDNFATCANGVTVLTDSSGTMPLPDRINLGSVSSGQFLNGYIRELAIFRSRRPNDNLQAMTQ